jgi:hypothetical protein
LRRVLPEQERAFGAASPIVASTHRSLAGLERDFGSIERAREHVERALEIDAAVFGETAEDTLFVRLERADGELADRHAESAREEFATVAGLTAGAAVSERLIARIANVESRLALADGATERALELVRAARAKATDPAAALELDHALARALLAHREFDAACALLAPLAETHGDRVGVNERLCPRCARWLREALDGAGRESEAAALAERVACEFGG